MARVVAWIAAALVTLYGLFWMWVESEIAGLFGTSDANVAPGLGLAALGAVAMVGLATTGQKRRSRIPCQRCGARIGERWDRCPQCGLDTGGPAR